MSFIQTPDSRVNSADFDVKPSTLLTVEQARHDLNVSRPTLYKLLNSGKLRSVQISRGARRISRQAIADYIAQAEAEAAGRIGRDGPVETESAAEPTSA